MGAEQSRDGAHTGFKRTEIANFDFRDNDFSKDGSTGYQQRQRGSNERYNNNDRRMGKECDDDSKSRNVSHNNRSNTYWLEVGMDVVKRLENDNNRFYSR